MPTNRENRATQIKDSLTLNHVSGLGPLLLQQLRMYFKTSEKILNATPHRLQQIPGIGAETAKRIAGARFEFRHQVEKEFSEALQMGFHFCLLDDPDFPVLLKEIFDPPLVLTIRGKLPQPVFPAIAIVGSRRASRYGLSQANHFARELASSGIHIVSGLARGVDAAAHRGALDAGGSTLAVLGCGASITYPPEHETLSAQIENSGAILSEFNLNSLPLPHHFPRRNRLIAGLAQAVLVIEAARKSGSLITARLACEYGRDIHVVPGPVDRSGSWGTGRLLRDGAVPVLTPEHVMEEIRPLLDSRESRNGLLANP